MGKAAPTVRHDHIRTEFIVMFVWKEPTPSDARRGMDSGTPSTPAPFGGPKK
jgi:hypothetical protein